MYFCASFSSLCVYFIIQNKGRQPSPRSATGLWAHIIYFKHSSFLAWGSCFRGRHFTPNGQVGSQRANGIICRIVKEKNITIWVPCEDSNLMQSAQRRQSQVGREFCVLLSVLVYFCIPRRSAVQIAHALVLPFGTTAMICSYCFYFYVLWFLLSFIWYVLWAVK